MPIRLAEFALMERTATTSLCHGCQHLQGANPDGTARCAAFSRIPAAVWDGEADHRTTLPGDRGVTFAPLGDYGRAVERAWVASALAVEDADTISIGDETVVDEPEDRPRPERVDTPVEQSATDRPEEFHTLMVEEGEPTGDRRIFDNESLWWRTLPIALEWGDGWDHDKIGQVGWITRVEREGSEIHGWGHLFRTTAGGADLATLLEEAGRLGVSVVADDTDVEIEFPEPLDGGDDEESFFFPDPDVVRITRGRICALTVVTIPAIDRAFIEPLPPLEEVEAEEDAAALIAAAIPNDPPPDWFTDPALAAPTALVVSDEGQVFGHLAVWGTCHTGFQGACITPPREGVADHFTTGEVACSDGSRVCVGQITLGTGHASLSADPRATAAHYDHTGAAVADVACGEDEHGIWLAGALRPGTDAATIRTLRASALSGDWRRVAGRLRLVAVLAVNVPGYPVPRVSAHVASGEQTALTAAGSLAPYLGPRRAGGTPRRLYGALSDRIAGRVGRDLRTRAAAAHARVHVGAFGCNCGKSHEERQAARALARARVASGSGAQPPALVYTVVAPDGSESQYPNLLAARNAQRAVHGRLRVNR
jgi:hypothetical protein